MTIDKLSYVKPEITIEGSVRELTLSFRPRGAGDVRNPGATAVSP